MLRCFIVVPRGAGFCIINEILHVTFPTAANTKRAFTSPESSMQTLNKPQVLVNPGMKGGGISPVRKGGWLLVSPGRKAGGGCPREGR